MRMVSTGTTGLGHNHEWDEMWHTDKDGNYVHKKGWVFCRVCNQTKLWNSKENEDG